MTGIATRETLSAEELQRRFYGLDKSALERIVEDVMTEEFSVVDGGILENFEEAAAGFLGSRHSVAVSNGTAALHLALFAMDLGPGDEVIIPSYAYYAAPLAVCLLGATPVFCDVRADDLTIDLEDAERVRTARTRAMIVHQPHGYPADAESLRAYADANDLKIIADAAQAHGATWQGQPLGHFYDYVCSSFGKGKLISGGELGVVTASEDRCRDRMLLYGHVNRVPSALLTDEYRHIDNAIGVKYRPHPFALALALEQMQSYEQRLARLVAGVEDFERELENVPGVSLFRAQADAGRVYWRFPVKLDEGGLDPAEVARRLQERGCPVTSNPRILAHRHNVVTGYYGVETNREFPVAEQLVQNMLHIDAYALYQDGAAERILQAFKDVMAG